MIGPVTGRRFFSCTARKATSCSIVPSLPISAPINPSSACNPPVWMDVPHRCRFENVAHRYIEEIRQVQPHGPYMLGGYCLGGTLALEMARQLIASGETWLVSPDRDLQYPLDFLPLSLRQRLINRWILTPISISTISSLRKAKANAPFSWKSCAWDDRIKASAHFAWARLRDRFQTHAAAPRRKPKLPTSTRKPWLIMKSGLIPEN